MKKLLLLCTLLGINTQTTCGDYSSYSSYSGGYSDPSSGYTDPNSGYSDPNSGYTDPNSGYTPPATKKYESNPVYTAPDGTQYTTKGTYTTPSTAKYETVQKYNTAQTINNKKYLDSALGNYNSTDAQNLTAKYKSTNHYQISNFLEYVDLSELGPVDRANLEIDYGKINKAIIDIETSITQLHQSLVDFSNQHPKAEVTVSIDNTSSSLTALYLMLISILNGMIQEQYNKLIRANPATTAKFNQFINKINQYDAKINPLAAYFSDAAKARKLYQNPRNQMAFSACALIMRHLAQQQSLTNENLSLAAKAYTQSKTHWDSSIHVPGDKPGTERYELYNNYINIISIAIKQEQAKINVNKAPIIAGDTNNSITTKIADYYQTTSIVYQDLQTLSGQPTSSGRNIQPDDNAALYTRKKSALISALSDYNSRNFDKAAQEFGSASIPLLQLAAELAQAQKKVKSGNSELEAAKAALKAWTNKSWNGLLSSLFGSSLPPNKVSPTRYKSTITELITKLQQAQTNYTTANEAFSKAAQLLIHAQGQPNNNANLMLPSFKSLQNNNASNNAKDCQATVNTISNLITMLNAFTKLSDTNSLNSFETIAKNIALAGRNASASYDHDVQSLLVIPFAQPSSAQPNFVNFANLLAGLYATTRAHNIPGQIKNSQNWYLAALPYLLSNQALTNKVIKDLPATKATSAAKISLNLAKNTPSWANTATKKNQYSSAALSSWHTALSKGMATYVIAAQLPTNNSARQPAISMYTNIAQSFLQATSKVSDASFANTKAMLKPLLLYYKQLVQPNVDTKVVQAVDALFTNLNNALGQLNALQKSPNANTPKNLQTALTTIQNVKQQLNLLIAHQDNIAAYQKNKKLVTTNNNIYSSKISPSKSDLSDIQTKTALVYKALGGMYAKQKHFNNALVYYTFAQQHMPADQKNSDSSSINALKSLASTKTMYQAVQRVGVVTVGSKQYGTQVKSSAQIFLQPCIQQIPTNLSAPLALGELMREAHPDQSKLRTALIGFSSTIFLYKMLQFYSISWSEYKEWAPKGYYSGFTKVFNQHNTKLIELADNGITVDKKNYKLSIVYNQAGNSLMLHFYPVQALVLPKRWYPTYPCAELYNASAQSTITGTDKTDLNAQQKGWFNNLSTDITKQLGQLYLDHSHQEFMQLDQLHGGTLYKSLTTLTNAKQRTSFSKPQDAYKLSNLLYSHYKTILQDFAFYTQTKNLGGIKSALYIRGKHQKSDDLAHCLVGDPTYKTPKIDKPKDSKDDKTKDSKGGKNYFYLLAKTINWDLEYAVSLEQDNAQLKSMYHSLINVNQGIGDSCLAVDKPLAAPGYYDVALKVASQKLHDTATEKTLYVKMMLAFFAGAIEKLSTYLTGNNTASGTSSSWKGRANNDYFKGIQSSYASYRNGDGGDPDKVQAYDTLLDALLEGMLKFGTAKLYAQKAYSMFGGSGDLTATDNTTVKTDLASITNISTMLAELKSAHKNATINMATIKNIFNLANTLYSAIQGRYFADYQAGKSASDQLKALNSALKAEQSSAYNSSKTIFS